MVLTIWEFGNKAEKILIISISYSNQVHHFIYLFLRMWDVYTKFLMT